MGSEAVPGRSCRFPLAGALLLVCGIPNVVAAQRASDAVREVIATVEAGQSGTPDGGSLLETAISEAAIARRHAELALADTTDLAGMKRHAAHVLHAVDPSRAAGDVPGPGLGYGALQAVVEIHTGLADTGAATGLSEAASLHRAQMEAAASGALARSERVSEVVERVRAARTWEEGLLWAKELVRATRELVTGRDLDDDRRIEPEEGEAGIAAIRWHLTLLKRGEGIGPR